MYLSTPISKTTAVMLLPMILRSLISGGAPNAGETTRKELNRVAVGIPAEVTLAAGLSIQQQTRFSSGPNSPVIPTQINEGEVLDEGVADVGVGADGENEEEKVVDKEEEEQARWKVIRDRAERTAERNGKAGVKIGFFLHTPFPSSEIYR